MPGKMAPNQPLDQRSGRPKGLKFVSCPESPPERGPNIGSRVSWLKRLRVRTRCANIGFSNASAKTAAHGYA